MLGNEKFLFHRNKTRHRPRSSLPIHGRLSILLHQCNVSGEERRETIAKSVEDVGEGYTNSVTLPENR